MGTNPAHSAPRIALLHHTGGGNLGDDASLASVLHNIKQRWPQASVAAFSMNPGDTQRRHGIPAYPLRRHTWGSESAAEDSKGASGLTQWFRTTRNPAVRLPRAVLSEAAFLLKCRRRIEDFDLLILAGGGQLTERSGPWAFPYAILSWLLIAKSAGKRCILLNVGAGPLTRKLARRFARYALEIADYVSFRDEDSLALAREIGFRGESQVFPDNVYALEVPACSARGPERGPVVGIAPMDYPVDPPFDDNREAVYQDLISRLATFGSILASQSYSIALFGTDVGADPAAIRDLGAKLESEHRVVAAANPDPVSVDDLLRQMAALDYVVTCRFHGVVFAHLLNKPVLAISPHAKVTSLMEALGLAEYCVDIRSFDPAVLAKIFDRMVRNRSDIQARMAATAGKFREQLNAQFDELWRPAASTLARAQGIQ
jgi:polysaccharide pyruvyl transferase WcaK-like protein